MVDTADRSPTLIVLLCHGYGASGDDLVGLAETLAPRKSDAGCVRFVFPEAPLDLRPMLIAQGRAWWHLDPAMLQQRAKDLPGFAKVLRQHVWPGVTAARKALREATEACLTTTGLGYDRLILGGFSQGAMLTTDLTLRLDDPPAGLMVLSGNLVDEGHWRPLMAKRRGLRVVQSHGRGDPILPFVNAEALCEALREHGNTVHFEAFDGGHTIPQQVLAPCRALVEETVQRP